MNWDLLVVLKIPCLIIFVIGIIFITIQWGKNATTFWNDGKSGWLLWFKTPPAPEVSQGSPQGKRELGPQWYMIRPKTWAVRSTARSEELSPFLVLSPLLWLKGVEVVFSLVPSRCNVYVYGPEVYRPLKLVLESLEPWGHQWRQVRLFCSSSGTLDPFNPTLISEPSFQHGVVAQVLGWTAGRHFGPWLWTFQAIAWYHNLY